MATIHLARNQQTLGSFSEEEIREGIRTGRFTGKDLVWRVGMETWKPLGEIAPLWGLDTPPPVPPAEAASSTLVLEIVGEGTQPAWEERETLGFFTALSRTVGAVLMRPAETFAQMKREGGLTNPLLYFVILSCATYAASVCYQLISFSAESGKLPEQLQHMPKNMLSFTLLGTILLSPALYVVIAFLGSGLTHLSLKLLGGAKYPFETTFRVICYAQASASVFNLLPLCGGLMAIIWGAYTIIIGLMKAQEISGWKAALAFLLPGLLCCGLFLMCGVAAGISLADFSKLGH